MAQPRAQRPHRRVGGVGRRLSGVGLGSRWGVFRYPWVIAKLALLVSVLAVGGFVLSPAEDAALDGTGGSAGRIAGATRNVCALLVAVGLSVFKPGAPSVSAGCSPKPSPHPADPSAPA